MMSKHHGIHHHNIDQFHLAIFFHITFIKLEIFYITITKYSITKKTLSNRRTASIPLPIALSDVIEFPTWPNRNFPYHMISVFV